MKKLLLIALFLIGASAWAQPKLAKQYGLTEVKQSYSVSGQSAKPTRIFTGKNGCLIYTGRNYYGWVFDSLTNDTIRYEMTFPKMKGAMRAAEPIPPVTEPLEVPQDLLDKAPQSMAPMRQAASAAITIKSPSTYFVMDFYSVQMLGGPQKAVDYITLRHAIRQQINQAGGDDVQRTIAGIYLMPNLQNKYDSLFQDPRYTGGSKANTALRWSAEQFINFGSQSSFITLYPLNFGGLAYRNPTWNRGGAAGIINGSQYAIADPWTYDFTNYCIPHEMDGHGAGNYHTFNCIEYTDPTGKPMKLDSSYNEGSCSSPIKCGDWGDILSYRHICSGGRIRAIWKRQSLTLAQNRLCQATSISGVYLAGITLRCDSVKHKDQLFRLTISTISNHNGTNWELYENGTRIQSGSLTQSAMNQSITLQRPAGKYSYEARILGLGLTHLSDVVPIEISAPVAPLPCTYTYSTWSQCTNGTQTRTVISATPQGCIGTPVLSQSCTVAPIIQLTPLTRLASGKPYNTTNTSNLAFDGIISDASRWLTCDTATITETYGGREITRVELYNGFGPTQTNTYVMVWADDQLVFGTASNTNQALIIPINRTNVNRIICKTFGAQAGNCIRVSRVREWKVFGR